MPNYADRLTKDGVAIFLFHGVHDGVETRVRNYTRKHIPKDYFIEVLSDLQLVGTAVSMDDIIAGHLIPTYAFAVTFDDGFENNLTIAAPILAEKHIPATFYITTGFVDCNRMSWIDRIEYALEDAPDGKLRLPWGDVTFWGWQSALARRVGVRQWTVSAWLGGRSPVRKAMGMLIERLVEESRR